MTIKPDKNGWFPIETAPKDGQNILLYNDLYCTFIGYYDKADEVNIDFPHFFSSGNYTLMRIHATHWRPIPEPPEGV